VPIVLQETQRALFYAPFYAALTHDAYRQAGVDVVLGTGATPSDAARAVLTGDADLAWGGPMRVMVEHDRDRSSDLICFCEVVTRDPFFLIGKESRPDFRFAQLRDLRIGAVKEVPTPWMCLQHDLRREGIDPLRLDVRFDRGLADNVDALRDGEVDVIQTFEPFVQELVTVHQAHVWHAAATRGPTCYTSFYARRRVVECREPAFRAMTGAIHRTQQWLHAASADEIASAIAPYFKELALERISGAIARYKALGIWGRDPYVSTAGYERLQQALLSGGLISSTLPYESGVDNRFAEAVASRQQIGFRAPDG
jgi:NitT/TauT family transport system substrate-binding protein